MALNVLIRDIEPRPAACIRITTTMDTLPQVMGAMYGEIMGVVKQAGAAPTGMPFARYYDLQGNDVDLECGIYVPI